MVTGNESNQAEMGAAEGVCPALARILGSAAARADPQLAEHAVHAVSVLCRHGTDTSTANQDNINALGDAGVIPGLHISRPT